MKMFIAGVSCAIVLCFSAIFCYTTVVRISVLESNEKKIIDFLNSKMTANPQPVAKSAVKPGKI